MQQGETMSALEVVMMNRIGELNEEVKRLQAEIKRLSADTLKDLSLIDELKAENERLRKAGDAMADEIIGCYKGEGYDPKDSETLPKWLAAKEGRPNE